MVSLLGMWVPWIFPPGWFPTPGPCREINFPLKKGVCERRNFVTTQPGGYSSYASLDCRAELQHTALSGIDMSMFFSGSQLEWQAHSFKKERIHFGIMYVALSCPMKSPSAMPEQTCHCRAVSWWGGKGRNARVKAWSTSYQQRSDKLETMSQLSSPKALLQVWSGVNNLPVRGKLTSWNQTWLQLSSFRLQHRQRGTVIPLHLLLAVAISCHTWGYQRAQKIKPPLKAAFVRCCSG